MKRITVLIVLGIILVLGLKTEVYGKEISLKINNHAIKTTVTPIQESGTTLVPIRVITENLGAKIEWEQENQKVTIKKNEKEIILTIGSKIAYVNNRIKPLQCAPRLIKGTTMVPIRLISEQLGHDVKWEKETQTVIIKNEGREYNLEDEPSRITISQSIELPKTAREDNYFEVSDGFEYFEVIIEGEINDLRWVKVDMNKVMEDDGTLKPSELVSGVVKDFGKVSNDVLILHLYASEGIPTDALVWTWPSGKEDKYYLSYDGRDNPVPEVIEDCY